MPRCIFTTYLDHDCYARIETEATRRGITRTALAREVLERAFPPPPHDDLPEIPSADDVPPRGVLSAVPPDLSQVEEDGICAYCADPLEANPDEFRIGERRFCEECFKHRSTRTSDGER